MSIFGTDGVRGVANKELTPQLAFQLGRAGAYHLRREAGTERPFILIGKDTRISGDMLEASLVAGICSVGADAVRLGVVPTPAVAWLTRQMGATAGVVISASHNPVEDNGIKFFGPNGYKLPDNLEAGIEELVFDPNFKYPEVLGAEVGRVREATAAKEKYLQHALATCPEGLAGLKIVVDCAQGAAHQITPEALTRLGAEVYPINAYPDGTNINKESGSTHPEALQREVVRVGADLGLAHDGDADRLLAVDEAGNLVDGDQIMVLCALQMKTLGLLKDNLVVVTVMSNLGLFQALEANGIQVVQTKVGDRYVLETMLSRGAVLGGEQSGHIIFLNYNTTGDGLVTGLQILQVMKQTGLPLSRLAAQMQRLPQVLHNVRVKDRNAWECQEVFQRALQQAAQSLGDRGRILVRPSGTEPLLRIMAEGQSEEELFALVASLAKIAQENL